MIITIPEPSTLLEILWFALGITVTRGISKRADQDIQGTEWFKKLSPLQQNILRRVLDITHHWWIGLIMVVYAPNVPEIYWFGWGAFVDDLPDIPARIKGYFETQTK